MVRAYSAVAILLAALLAGCSTGGGSGGLAGTLLGRDKPDDIPQDYFLARDYCPPVQIRGGTGVYATYERGHDSEPDFVRHQASITRAARECGRTADGMTIKVGVAGRAIAGPRGGAAEMNLPLRVVVMRRGGDVLHSQLYRVPVSVTPPALGTDFQRVVDPIPVNVGPDVRDIVVYVGFDEGRA